MYRYFITYSTYKEDIKSGIYTFHFDILENNENLERAKGEVGLADFSSRNIEINFLQILPLEDNNVKNNPKEIEKMLKVFLSYADIETLKIIPDELLIRRFFKSETWKNYLKK